MDKENQTTVMYITDEEDAIIRINKALDVIYHYGQVNGDHHKSWVIDQIVRNLCGDKYDVFVNLYTDGEDGPFTYYWDEGIPP